MDLLQVISDGLYFQTNLHNHHPAAETRDGGGLEKKENKREQTKAAGWILQQPLFSLPLFAH